MTDFRNFCRMKANTILMKEKPNFRFPLNFISIVPGPFYSNKTLRKFEVGVFLSQYGIC